MLQSSKKIMAVLMFLGVFMIGGLYSWAFPCEGKVSVLKQPDGTNVTVKLYGDEFYMRMEGLDGYTLTYDDKTKFICYANLNENSSEFVSTGLVYTDTKGSEMTVNKLSSLGLKKGMKLSEDSVSLKIKSKKEDLSFDKVLEESAQDAKKYIYASNQGVGKSVSKLVSPEVGDVKNVTGLAVLVDFPDQKPEISKEEVDLFLNSEEEAIYENSSSVMKYFKNISGGKFIYKNIVTPYYTAKHEKKYYEMQMDVEELINEVLDYLQSSGFDFSKLTVNDKKEVLGFNIMYAGLADYNMLWPHSSKTDYETRDGIKFKSYMVFDLPRYAPDEEPFFPYGPELTKFVHESAHILFGWPDTHDKYDIYGISGDSYGCSDFDVMSYCHLKNPPPPNPYFRCILAGWGNPIDLDQFENGKHIDINPNSLDPYMFKNQNSDEWFFIESIDKNGGYINLVREGLLIWHVDGTKSDNNSENMTPTNHYMVSLEQADGLFHYEQGIYGDEDDLFYKGNNDSFGPDTIPNSKWWNDNSPTIKITDIDEKGTSFTYEKVLAKDLTEEGNVTCDPTEENQSFLFDDILNTVFKSKGQEINVQNSFKGNEPYVLNKYTISLADDPGFDPTRWVLYGSNDNENWVQISNIKSPGFDIGKKTYTYIIKSGKSYSHYKFVFKGKINSHIELSDIQLLGYQYIETPQIWASSEKSSDFLAQNAFDKKASTVWATDPQEGWIRHWGNDAQEGWITYRYNKPIIVGKYQVTFADEVKSAPEEIKLWASNDGIQWSLLSNQTRIKYNAKNKYTFKTASTSDKFLFYKLEILSKETIQVSEIKYSK